MNSLAVSLAIRPDGRFLYVGDAGISVYAVDAANGALSIVSNSPAPAPFTDAIAIDAQGKFAFVSDSVNMISAYAIDPVTGLLTAVSMNQPASPSTSAASVTLRPDGKFAYVVYGGAIWGFSIDSETGALAAVSGPFATGVYAGAFAIDPSGKYAFAITEDGTITSYSINSSFGELTPISGAVAQIGPGGGVITVR
jgi:6-phosphogluconolactonase (cycloisomerase 2 family)